MLSEPQRSQYLEAMGLTAWVSRYRLPNAAPTQACDWLEPDAAPSQAPAQRLQALLDTPERPPDASPAAAPAMPPPGQARRARALLEGEAREEGEGSTAESATASASSVEPADAPDAAPSSVAQEALRFTLQVAALDGRWLLLLPDQPPPDATARRLLNNLLHAAGIVPAAAPEFQAFGWPMMEGLPVEAPLEEAQEGLRAFVDGRRRQGWRPERLLVFGESAALAPVLALVAGHCQLLDLPGWQGLSLSELAQSASAKRDLWPHVAEWRKAWQSDAHGAHVDDEGRGDAGTAS